ncbi:SAM complex subunit SAM50 PWA37_000017 [Arxiozyma heterogenica]|uniref:Bacterial surface antigen (D15) domain-containing protein n=1 Tax=Arxiozyma heterogenica TaxID=278026 RepID=A0AAN7WME6_9SACH|nr:hypothetical protein RI543_004378 [Kazachstania heterogenica]
MGYDDPLNKSIPNSLKPIPQQYIDSLLDNNANVPIKIVNVQPISITKAKGNTLSSETWEVYINSTLSQCEKLSDIPTQLDILNSRLLQANLINGLHPIFHTINSSTFNSNSDDINFSNPLPIVATLYYQPKSKFAAKTGTNITNSGQGDGYVSFQSRLPTDDIVTLDYRRDTGTNSGTRFSISSPFLKRTPFWSWTFDLFDIWKNVGVKDVGCTMGIRSWYNSTRLWNLGINYELIKRNFSSLKIHTSSVPSLSISPSKKNISEYLLIQDGTSIRQSLKGNLIWDCRDNSFAPTRGHFFKVNSELTHVESGSKFWKNMFECNKVQSWLQNDFITMSTTFRCGYITNLTFLQNKYIHYTDKFQNGGANDIRSFQNMGIGPRHLGCNLGGDTFMAYGVSVFSKLPIKKLLDSNFRLHFFFNGGKLVNHNNNDWISTISKLSSEHSTSIGTGVTLRHPMARFELNFAVPFTCHSDDLQRRGFQFGLGFEFL